MGVILRTWSQGGINSVPRPRVGGIAEVLRVTFAHEGCTNKSIPICVVTPYNS